MKKKPNVTGPIIRKVGACIFVGCKVPPTVHWQSYDHKVDICAGHAPEWGEMCERATQADR